MGAFESSKIFKSLEVRKNENFGREKERKGRKTERLRGKSLGYLGR
jgi:hypothetical protein